MIKRIQANRALQKHNKDRFSRHTSNDLGSSIARQKFNTEKFPIKPEAEIK